MKLVVQGVPAESCPGGDGNTFWQRPAHRVQVSQRRSSEDVGRRLLHISIKEGAEIEKKKKRQGERMLQLDVLKESARGRAGASRARR